MTPRLETPRLVLRPLAPGDWDAVEALLSDPLVIRYMHFAMWTAGQCRQWFDECVTSAWKSNRDALYWAVTRRDSGGVIGYVSIVTSNDDDAAVAGEREVGYALDRAEWNQGYMTEVLRAVLADELGARGTTRLRASCNVANPASARVMEKAGMRRERTVFDANFAGASTHWHHYAITKAEYDGRS